MEAAAGNNVDDKCVCVGCGGDGVVNQQRECAKCAFTAALKQDSGNGGEEEGEKDGELAATAMGGVVCVCVADSQEPTPTIDIGTPTLEHEVEMATDVISNNAQQQQQQQRVSSPELRVLPTFTNARAAAASGMLAAPLSSSGRAVTPRTAHLALALADLATGITSHVGAAEAGPAPKRACTYQPSRQPSPVPLAPLSAADFAPVVAPMPTQGDNNSSGTDGDDEHDPFMALPEQPAEHLQPMQAVAPPSPSPSVHPASPPPSPASTATTVGDTHLHEEADDEHEQEEEQEQVAPAAPIAPVAAAAAAAAAVVEVGEADAKLKSDLAERAKLFFCVFVWHLRDKGDKDNLESLFCIRNKPGAIFKNHLMSLWRDFAHHHGLVQMAETCGTTQLAFALDCLDFEKALMRDGATVARGYKHKVFGDAGVVVTKKLFLQTLCKSAEKSAVFWPGHRTYQNRFEEVMAELEAEWQPLMVEVAMLNKHVVDCGLLKNVEL